MAKKRIVNPPKQKPQKVYAGGTRLPQSIRIENQLFRDPLCVCGYYKSDHKRFGVMNKCSGFRERT